MKINDGLVMVGWTRSMSCKDVERCEIVFWEYFVGRLLIVGRCACL
jgi:hypothetical protein